MKQKHPLKRLGVLLLAALLACSMIGTAFADATTDKGSITIKLEEKTGLGSPKGVGFKLYRVGDWNISIESWTLVSGLSGIDFSSLNGSSQWSNAAQTLAQQTSTLVALTTKSGATGDDGTLTFSSLKLGMYLVVQEGTNNYGTIAPFLAALPVMGNNGYTNEVTCSPKASAFPEPEPEPTPTPTPGGSSHDHSKRYPTTSAGAISPLPPVETPLPTTPATGTNTSPSQQPTAPTTSEPLPDEPQPTEPSLPDEPTQPAGGDTTQPEQQPQNGDDAPEAKNGWILPTAAGVAAAAVVGGIVLFRKRPGKTQ